MAAEAAESKAHPKLTRAASLDYINQYFSTIFDANAASTGSGAPSSVKDEDEALASSEVEKDDEDLALVGVDGGDGELVDERETSVREALSSLWDKYDADGNNILSPEELTSLMAAYLATCETNAVALAESHFSAKLRKALEVRQAQDDRIGDADVDAIIAEVLAECKGLKNGVASLYRRLGSDKEVLAKRSLELMSAMDEDGDGKVSRDEFMRTFMDVLTKVIDARRIDEYIAPQLMAQLRGLNGRIKRYLAKKRKAGPGGTGRGDGLLCGRRDSSEEGCLLL